MESAQALVQVGRGAKLRRWWRRWRHLAIAAAISLLVTAAKLAGTYDDFLESTLTWSTALLFAINAVVTVVIVELLRQVVRPTNKSRYALVVGLSFQALVAGEIEIEPLAGGKVPGQSEAIRIGDVYGPIETLVSGSIGDAVEKAKLQETNTFVGIYGRDGAGLKSLEAKLLPRLESDDSLTAGEKSDLACRADRVLGDRSLAPSAKARTVALALYANSARDVVDYLIHAQGEDPGVATRLRSSALRCSRQRPRRLRSAVEPRLAPSGR
jgi:hypothetical protein